MGTKDLNISNLMDCYGGCLTEKQREVMELYYNDDYSLAEIAELSGITRQGVRDSIKRAEASLLELEALLGVLEQQERNKKLLRDITEAAIQIGRYNVNNIHSPQLTKLVNELLALSDVSEEDETD